MKTNFKMTKLNCIPFKGIKIIMLLSIIISFNSCKKETTELKKESINTIMKEDKVLYNKLIKAGFKPENIKDTGDAYLVEGDMLFIKLETDLNYFDTYFGLNNKNKNEPNSISQFRTNGIISSQNVEKIKVNNVIYLGDRSLALKNWVDILDSKINFYPGVLSNNTINSITFLDDSNLGSYATAEFPRNGVAGYRIRINPNLMNSLSQNQRIFILTHEIGHCLGFRHSDMLYSRNRNVEIADPDGYVQIPGTPDFDSNSIMNSGDHYNGSVPNWPGFSNYDKIAARSIYPYRSYDKWITFPGGKYPSGISVVIDYDLEIKWNANLVSTNTVSIEAFQYGQSRGIVASNILNDGSVNLNPWSFLNDDYGGFNDVQIKIISNKNPSITDLSIPFYITY